MDEMNDFFKKIDGQVTQPPMNTEINQSFRQTSQNQARVGPRFQNLPAQGHFQQLNRGVGSTVTMNSAMDPSFGQSLNTPHAPAPFQNHVQIGQSSQGLPPQQQFKQYNRKSGTTFSSNSQSMAMNCAMDPSSRQSLNTPHASAPFQNKVQTGQFSQDIPAQQQCKQLNQATVPNSNSNFQSIKRNSAMYPSSDRSFTRQPACATFPNEIRMEPRFPNMSAQGLFQQFAQTSDRTSSSNSRTMTMNGAVKPSSGQSLNKPHASAPFQNHVQVGQSSHGLPPQQQWKQLNQATVPTSLSDSQSMPMNATMNPSFGQNFTRQPACATFPNQTSMEPRFSNTSARSDFPQFAQTSGPISTSNSQTMAMNSAMDPSFGQNFTTPQAFATFQNGTHMKPNIPYMPAQSHFQQFAQTSGPASSSSSQSLYHYDMNYWFKTVVEGQDFAGHSRPIAQMSQPSMGVSQTSLRPTSNVLRADAPKPLKDCKPYISPEHIENVEDMDIFMPRKHRDTGLPRVNGKLKNYLLHFFDLPEDLRCTRQRATSRVCERIKNKTGKDIYPILVSNLLDTLKRKQKKFEESSLVQGYEVKF